MPRTTLLISATLLLACGSGLEPALDSGDEVAGESSSEAELGDTADDDAASDTASDADPGADESESESGEPLEPGCGNGVRELGETCDDGNVAAGDGCSGACRVECGHLCPDAGGACRVGFVGVQCASPGGSLGDPHPLPNDCRLVGVSLDGSELELGFATRIDGEPRHLDALFFGPDDTLFGFAGDSQNVEAGSQLVAVDPRFGAMTPIGPSLGVWVMGAAMNDAGEVWVTVFDTYERNMPAAVRIAQIDPNTGMFVSGPTTPSESGEVLQVYSIHVSDVAFRSDGAMFISGNGASPPDPWPASRYLEIDPASASVVAAIEGPQDLYAAGFVFVGDDDRIVAMDIAGEDDIFLLDLAQPPLLAATQLYADPIPSNSGTADLASCSSFAPQ